MRHLLCVSTFVVLGCSTAEGDVSSSESSEASQTITPNGLGGLGQVTIELPPSFQSHVPSLDADFRFTFNGTPITPGVPTKVTPTPTGDHWGTLRVDLVSSSTLKRLSRMQDFHTLAPGEARTIRLSLVKLWWTDRPLVGARGEVDVAMAGAQGHPRLKRRWGGQEVVHWRTVSRDYDRNKEPDFNDDYFFFGMNDIALPVPPGPFAYSFGSLPPTTFDVPELQQVDFNGDNHRFTGMLKVTYPDREGMEGRTPYTLLCPTAAANVTGERPFARLLLDRDSVACELRLSSPRPEVTGISKPVVLQAGAEVSFADLRRLNVRDVTLTDEPGVTVRGTFEVRAVGVPVTAPPIAESQTGYGMDLPTGTYDVRVRYQAHGVSKEASYKVTL